MLTDAHVAVSTWPLPCVCLADGASEAGEAELAWAEVREPRASQQVARGPAAAAPGNSLGIQIVGLHPTPPESEFPG